MEVLTALVLDLLFGEPRGLHPVRLMGGYLAWAWPRVRGFWSGAGYWLLGAVLFTLPYALLDLLLRPLFLGWVWIGFFLKPLFSLRLLFEEVSAVGKTLEAPGAQEEALEEARRRLSRIVSRKTADLSVEEVREAALESLSENLSDSFVAPLFYYVLFGLKGAALYRYANTADAMWGYVAHGKRGAFAARADDLLNLIPARLTALFLAPPTSFRTLLEEARKTPSPNAGFPMAALALALGVRLRKRGSYALNPLAPSPTAQDFQRGLLRAGLAAGAAGLAFALLEVLKELAASRV